VTGSSPVPARPLHALDASQGASSSDSEVSAHAISHGPNTRSNDVKGKRPRQPRLQIWTKS